VAQGWGQALGWQGVCSSDAQSVSLKELAEEYEPMAKRLTMITLVLGLLAIGSTAQAVPITGGALFGIFLETDTGNVATANTLYFGLPQCATCAGVNSFFGGDGSYAGVPVTPVTIATLSIDPFVGPLASFWTFTVGPTTYSFDLLTLSVLQVPGPFGTLTLNGTGIAYITGFDPTPGSFSLTSQNPGSVIGGDKVFSFSASTDLGEPIPEPGTLLLIGTGLTGLAVRRRRRG
jgi:hypothetical protein